MWNRKRNTIWGSNSATTGKYSKPDIHEKPSTFDVLLFDKHERLSLCHRSFGDNPCKR